MCECREGLLEVGKKGAEITLSLSKQQKVHLQTMLESGPARLVQGSTVKERREEGRKVITKRKRSNT